MENNISSKARLKSKEIMDKKKPKSQLEIYKYGHRFSTGASTLLQHNIPGYLVSTFAFKFTEK